VRHDLRRGEGDCPSTDVAIPRTDVAVCRLCDSQVLPRRRSRLRAKSNLLRRAQAGTDGSDGLTWHEPASPLQDTLSTGRSACMRLSGNCQSTRDAMADGEGGPTGASCPIGAQHFDDRWSSSRPCGSPASASLTLASIREREECHTAGTSCGWLAQYAAVKVGLERSIGVRSSSCHTSFRIAVACTCNALSGASPHHSQSHSDRIRLVGVRMSCYSGWQECSPPKHSTTDGAEAEDDALSASS
jgi:hypothetical protein